MTDINDAALNPLTHFVHRAFDRPLLIGVAAFALASLLCAAPSATF